MNKDKEKMAREFVLQVNELDGSKASMGMVNFTAHAMIDTYLVGFDAGQAHLLDQASGGFEEWWIDFVKKDLGLNCQVIPDHKIEKAWQASALSSAKLLAEKDAEIKEMQNHIEFQSQVMVDMGGVVLENKKLEADLDIAKELIKEMREALGFYGVKYNWTTIYVGYGDRVLISRADREDLSTTDRLVEYGGKLARKTLKENTDKIKALLGEE